MTLQNVIKDHREVFLQNVYYMDIVSTLKVYDLIPEGVEHDITHAKSGEAANGHLLTFLMHAGTNVLHKRQCLAFPFISSCIMQVSVNC